MWIWVQVAWSIAPWAPLEILLPPVETMGGTPCLNKICPRALISYGLGRGGSSVAIWPSPQAAPAGWAA